MTLYDTPWPAADTPPPYPGGRQWAHTVVIGAGLSGLSAAYHILRADPRRELVILDAECPGAGASGRSSGMLTPGIGQDLAALVRRCGADTARRLYLESLRAVHYAIELLARENIACALHQGGQLLLARGPRGRIRLAARARLMQKLQLPHETLDDTALSEQLRLAFTAPGSSELPAALYFREAAVLDPALLVRGLVQSVKSLGGRFYQAEVREVGQQRPALLSLRGDAEIRAEQVVLAVGGAVPALGILRGRVLPVRLYALATEPLPEQTLRGMGWDRGEGVIDSRRLFNYFRLTAQKRLVFGGGLPAYAAAARGEVHKGALLRRALCSTLPGMHEIGISHVWSGVIDYVLDTLPLIQRLPSHPAVLHIGGWCGHGIALSLAAGAWAAHILEHNKPPAALPWFRHSAPLLPWEWLRRAGFYSVTRSMALLDRCC